MPELIAYLEMSATTTTTILDSFTRHYLFANIFNQLFCQYFQPIILPIFSPYFLPIFSTIWLWLDPVISYLNNESVSWVRRADSHIIAVDREVFISDQRFISSIQKLSNLWILKVNQQQISISNYQIPIFWIFE